MDASTEGRAGVMAGPAHEPGADRSPIGLLVDDDLVAAADHHQESFARHQREFFRRLAEIDLRALWESDGCRDMAQWVSGRYHVSAYQARLWVDAAHALQDLPLISTSFENGGLSIDKTVQLARFASPGTEAELLPWAKRVTVRTIRRRTELAERREVSETVAADKDRSLTSWLFDNDTRMAIQLEVPAAEGAMAMTAIDRLAQRKPRDPDVEADAAGVELEGFDATVDQRRADAFLELCSQSIDSDFDADRATVVVHAELAALLGDGTGCEIDGGPVIHAETARRLLCDPRLEVVVRDSRHGDGACRAGGIVGIGRASRVVPAPLFRKVLERDGGCTFPGCGARRYIHAHHVWHWIFGGPTDLDNLTIVCGFHHRLIHERGWAVHLGGDGTTTWFAPGMRVYTRGTPGPCRRRSGRSLRPLLGCSE